MSQPDGKMSTEEINDFLAQPIIAHIGTIASYRLWQRK
jgi:hypothetical protein